MKKGFTLIELLVVIAIIGILAAIIISNLGDARSLAKDSSGSATLSSARGAAELYYVETGNTYDEATATPGSTVDGLCDDATFEALIDDAAVAVDGTGATGTCHAVPTAYAATIDLTDDDTAYCIDSSGFAGEIAFDEADHDSETTCASIA